MPGRADHWHRHWRRQPQPRVIALAEKVVAGELTLDEFKAACELHVFRAGVAQGIAEALGQFAWWHDGEQYIGQQRPNGEGARTLEECMEIMRKLAFGREEA